MSQACSQCAAPPAVSRWKKVGAWVGVLFFCPCHLPITIAGFLALFSGAGIPIAASWGRPLLYGVFGLTFSMFALLLVRWAMRMRGFEREQETHDALHAPGTTAATSPFVPKPMPSETEIV